MSLTAELECEVISVDTAVNDIAVNDT
ncbi:MAG: hypothetical protein ACJAZD_002747, partial [Ilumatobacter sp.]